MTIDIHKVITGNPITKNLMNHGEVMLNLILYEENCSINILDLEIQYNNKLILILIQVKYIKFMILLLQTMIGVQCFMM